jgi:hypothetical protein
MITNTTNPVRETGGTSNRPENRTESHQDQSSAGTAEQAGHHP